MCRYYFTVIDIKTCVAGSCLTRPAATTQSNALPLGKNMFVQSDPETIATGHVQKKNARHVLRKDLVRLDLAHTDPVRRVESSNVSPIPEVFRGFPGNIFASEIGHDTVTHALLNDAACLQQDFTSQQLGAARKGCVVGKRRWTWYGGGNVYIYNNIRW